MLLPKAASVVKNAIGNPTATTATTAKLNQPSWLPGGGVGVGVGPGVGVGVGACVSTCQGNHKKGASTNESARLDQWPAGTEE